MSGSRLHSLRDDFARFPVEAQKALEQSVGRHVVPLKESIINQNEALQLEVLALKDQLVQANEWRLQSATEIDALNSKIRQHRVFEDVKRRELEAALFERRNQHAGGGKQRTEIPEVVGPAFEFPKLPRNYELRVKQKMAQRVYVEPPQLYSRTAGLRVPQGTAANADQFDDLTVAARLMDRDRAQHPEFYAIERLAVELPPAFTTIADDYSNRQQLVMPRLSSDRLDDDRHLIDIFNSNEDRLRALEGAPQAREKIRDRVDFDKVDRIIDALDSFKDKYFDDRRQERVYQELDLTPDPRL